MEGEPMKTLSTAILLLVFSVPCFGSPPQDTYHAEFLPNSIETRWTVDLKLARQTLLLKAYQGEAQVGAGTAFVVSRDHLLTAYHNFTMGGDRWTVTVNGKEIEVSIVRERGKALDIALIKAAEPIEISPLKIAKVAPKPGDTLTISGYAHGTDEFQTSGQMKTEISRDAYSPDEFVFGDTDIVVQAGMSGGPVINAKGEVVGVLINKYGAPVHNGARSVFVSLPGLMKLKE